MTRVSWHLSITIHYTVRACLTGAEMTDLSEKLNYDREVIRVWFCNKRQALKNTIKKLKGQHDSPSFTTLPQGVTVTNVNGLTAIVTS